MRLHPRAPPPILNFRTKLAPREIRGRVTGLFEVFVAIGATVNNWVLFGRQFTRRLQKSDFESSFIVHSPTTNGFPDSTMAGPGR